MLSRLRARLLIASLLFALGCTGSGTPIAAEEVVEESVLNVDSLLVVMDVRYNQLCAERKAAYSERNPELRRELLERNDAASKALDDSLRWVMSLKKDSQD